MPCPLVRHKFILWTDRWRSRSCQGGSLGGSWVYTCTLYILTVQLLRDQLSSSVHNLYSLAPGSDQCTLSVQYRAGVNILHYSQITHLGKVSNFLEIREEFPYFSVRVLFCREIAKLPVIYTEDVYSWTFPGKVLLASQLFLFSGKFSTGKISFALFATLFCPQKIYFLKTLPNNDLGTICWWLLEKPWKFFQKKLKINPWNASFS